MYLKLKGHDPIGLHMKRLVACIVVGALALPASAQASPFLSVRAAKRIISAQAAYLTAHHEDFYSDYYIDNCVREGHSRVSCRETNYLTEGGECVNRTIATLDSRWHVHLRFTSPGCELPQSAPSPTPAPGPTIPNYPNGKGYPVECSDGTWSQSGGIQGACSHHGGVG